MCNQYVHVIIVEARAHLATNYHAQLLTVMNYHFEHDS